MLNMPEIQCLFHGCFARHIAKLYFNECRTAVISAFFPSFENMKQQPNHPRIPNCQAHYITE